MVVKARAAKAKAKAKDKGRDKGKTSARGMECASTFKRVNANVDRRAGFLINLRADLLVFWGSFKSFVGLRLCARSLDPDWSWFTPICDL